MYSHFKSDIRPQPFLDKLLVLAIHQNREFLLQLAAITEAHHERLADVSQGRSYFRLGDRVSNLSNFSYGTIQQIRPNSNNYDYLVAWFNSNNRQKWGWIEEDSLTLSISFP